MFKVLRSQEGFSLVQGMIIAAVLAGSGLVATRLMTDQKMSQKGAESRGDIEQLHNLIYSTLQNRQHCEQTIRSNGLAVNLVTTGNITAPYTSNAHPALTTINTIFNSSPKILVRVNNGGLDSAATADDIMNTTTYVNGNVRVTAINIYYPIPSPSNPALIREGHGILRVFYQRLNSGEFSRTKTGYGSKDIMKEILLRIQKDESGDFLSCYAVTSTTTDANNDLNKEMCKSLNSTGAYDPDVPTPSLFVWDEEKSLCRMRDNICTDPGTINTGINSDGSKECRRISEWIDYTQIIQNTTTNCPPGSTMTLNVNDATKKISITCTP